jgi:DNA polymerase III subunit gamma/tau
MLGVADRGLVLDLLESVLRGDAAAALGQLERLYQEGADPLLVLQDLLDLGHFLTRLKLVPEAGAGDPIAEGDRLRLRPLAEKMTMPALTLVWQMLLKGIAEVQAAPSPIQAAEMVLIRLAYAADLPTPAELVRSLEGSRTAGASQTGSAPIPELEAAPSRAAKASDGKAADATARDATPAARAGPGSPTAGAMVGGALRAPVEETELAGAPAAPILARSDGFEPLPQSYAEVVALFDRRREALFRAHLWSHLHLVHFEPGRIEFRPAAGAPRDLANRLGQLLGEWTGTRWLIVVSEAEGEPTLQQQQERRDSDQRDEIVGHPLVKAVFEIFPGATIAAIRERFSAAVTDASEETADEPGIEEDEL